MKIASLEALFIKTKKPVNINEVDIKIIALSGKKSYDKVSFKYFIGYRHEGDAFPSLLCIKLPQMNAYAKYFDINSKYMNHLVKDEKILKKYLKIWSKIKRLIKKGLNSEPVYNDKYIKTKIKIINIMKYQKIMNIEHVYL